MMLNPAYEAGGIHGTGLSSDFATLMKQDQGRDAANPVTLGIFRFGFGIQLGQTHMGFELLCGLSKCRRHRAAGATPGRPEIDDDGEFTPLDVRCEAGGGQIERMSRKKRRLASTACAAFP